MSIYTHTAYRANGKLLLSAEYFVLDGAVALALPTRLGQRLTVKTRTEDDQMLGWKSRSTDKSIWFEALFDSKSLTCVQSDYPEIAKRLTEMFTAIRRLHPGFISPNQSFDVSTDLEFPREWGLGTSSTLIAMIAQWAGVDPYQLLEATFGGSGYDLACANKVQPIFYQRTPEEPIIQEADFKPAFKDQIYFAYLGKKQNSREGIQHYRQKTKQKETLIKEVSDLTYSFRNSQSLQDFSKAIDTHEKLVGDFIEMTPVKEKYFSDYWGSMKSLGAWGGDFILLTSDRSRKETEEYCNTKGLDVFFNYSELIL